MNPLIHPVAGPRLRVLALSAAATLAGCASFSDDGGFGRVADMTKERTGQRAVWQRSPTDVEAAQARVDKLLKRPLTAESSVELALLNNRGLQASFAGLGISESERVRAGRLANPSFAFGRLRGGGITEIDRSIVFDVLGLLALPLARQVEQGRFEQAQYQAAFDADARRAFFGAAAAQDLVRHFERVGEAADASGESARRMLRAATSTSSRRCASRPSRATPRCSSSGRATRRLQRAMSHRLDVLMARRSTEATAQALGLTKATHFVNVLHAGCANKSQTGEPRQNGYEIELELPPFDFGTARSARAEAV